MLSTICEIGEFREATLEYPLHSLGLIDPPKVLADIVESLIGAIFIDSNCMDTTWQVVKKLLQPLITLEKLEVNPVTKIYELCQKNGLKTKFVDQWEKTGEVEVFVDGKFVGKGKSCGKKITAKNRTANNAYFQLRNLSVKATIVDDQLCDETCDKGTNTTMEGAFTSSWKELLIKNITSNITQQQLQSVTGATNPNKLLLEASEFTLQLWGGQSQQLEPFFSYAETSHNNSRDYHQINALKMVLQLGGCNLLGANNKQQPTAAKSD
ncbi:ribonuclease 3-like protein 2 [Solanum dulcamara]|uniref:ribonuclease 3-like protein 2 n=1 Tax=Solanum dulcamara TaxID=45834 RepID=UPI002486989D|nr:ribonuclease 3-like protein 2 [Solanum dulcamara]